MGGQDAEKKRLQKSYFEVMGLCCSSEVDLIENILNSLEGVKKYSVIVPTKTLIVFHDDLLVSQLQIVKALNQARLEANVRVEGNGNYKRKWPSPYAVCSGILVLVSLLKFVYNPLRWVALGAVAVGILPIFLKVIASLRNFRLHIHFLVLIAVGGTIALNDYIEAGTIVFLFSIAEWLESRASHKAKAVMSSLMSLAPVNAVLAETGEQVNVDEVKMNTLLVVKSGEVIPIDGIVVDGQGEADEKALTGESFPVTKEKDSTVLAGSIILNGYITIKTTALAEDCVVAKMTKLVEEAQNSKTRTQRFIDKCAKYYIPLVAFISLIIAVVPFAFSLDNKKYWLHLAIVVLVSACPCALILSTPVATFCALTKAATVGLLIKGGSYLEILAKVKVMAVDKTGTITRGDFVVSDFQSLSSDISSDTLLYWVSSIESKSSHPMAAAIVDYVRSLEIDPKPENVEEFQNFPGEGIHGKIDGKDIYIGNRKIALRAHSKIVPILGDDRQRGKTVGYIYCGEEPAGFFCLSDACRIGVEKALNDLKRLGIKTAMLTGDCQEAAMYAQQQLNSSLDIVYAELLPEDKVRIIKEFQQEGKTAMIGDGINDAPALAVADIGISMGVSGSALANETGNVILMSNDIRKVPKAIKLARKSDRKVKENVFISISTKAAILCLAISGHPLVWAAVLVDVGTCLLVIFNSMLLLRGTGNPRAEKCYRSSATPQKPKNVDEDTTTDHQKCCSNKKLQDSNHQGMDTCGSNRLSGSSDRQDNGIDEGICTRGCCNKVEYGLEKKKKGIEEEGNCNRGCCNKVEYGLEKKKKGIEEEGNCNRGCCNKVEYGLEKKKKGIEEEGNCNRGCCNKVEYGLEKKKKGTEEEGNCNRGCCNKAEYGLEKKKKGIEEEGNCNRGCCNKVEYDFEKMKKGIEEEGNCNRGCCNKVEYGLEKKKKGIEEEGNCNRGCCNKVEYGLEKMKKGIEEEGNCNRGCCNKVEYGLEKKKGIEEEGNCNRDYCNKVEYGLEKKKKGIEEGNCNGGCCNKVEYDLESNIQQRHGCFPGSQKLSSTAKHECSNLLETEDICRDRDGAFEVNVCHQKHTGAKPHDHFNLSSGLEEGHRSDDPCCHSNHFVEEAATNGKPLRNLERSRELQHEERGVRLDTREIGGCCKKQCCKENEQFSAGAGACLTEIITE